MAEGDTIHRLASQLADEIGGSALSRVWLRDRGDIPALEGARVSEVRALGKHLLMRFSPCRAKSADARQRGEEDWILHTHLGMPGRWQRGAGGRGGETPSARLEFNAEVPPWCCRRPAVCELFPRSVLRTHPVLRALGPDLLAPPVPFDAVVRRARRSRAKNLAELLLDQRVACGLGNVYKSELLFLHGVSPHTAVRQVTDDTIEALFRDGAFLLQRNTGPGRRRTRGVDPAAKLAPGEPRLWVYGRAGRPCLRCAAPVGRCWMGEPARVTYRCARCQPDPTLRSAAARGTGMETPSRFPRA